MGSAPGETEGDSDGEKNIQLGGTGDWEGKPRKRYEVEHRGASMPIAACPFWYLGLNSVLAVRPMFFCCFPRSKCRRALRNKRNREQGRARTGSRERDKSWRAAAGSRSVWFACPRIVRT